MHLKPQAQAPRPTSYPPPSASLSSPHCSLALIHILRRRLPGPWFAVCLRSSLVLYVSSASHVELDTSRCRRTPWMPNINHPAALGHQWPGPWPARQLRFRSPGFSHLWSEPMTRSHKCFGSGVLGDSRCCSLLVPWTPSGFRKQWSRGVRWTSSS